MSRRDSKKVLASIKEARETIGAEVIGEVGPINPSLVNTTAEQNDVKDEKRAKSEIAGYRVRDIVTGEDYTVDDWDEVRLALEGKALYPPKEPVTDQTVFKTVTGRVYVEPVFEDGALKESAQREANERIDSLSEVVEGGSYVLDDPVPDFILSTQEFDSEARIINPESGEIIGVLTVMDIALEGHFEKYPELADGSFVTFKTSEVKVLIVNSPGEETADTGTEYSITGELIGRVYNDRGDDLGSTLSLPFTGFLETYKFYESCSNHAEDSSN